MQDDDDARPDLTPEQEKVLAAFDPSVPMLLGNTRYSANCRGSAPASPYQQQKRALSPMCHGGGGYALSHAALAAIGPRALGCGSEWPANVFEDATVGFCLLRHLAVGAHPGRFGVEWIPLSLISKIGGLSPI